MIKPFPSISTRLTPLTPQGYPYGATDAPAICDHALALSSNNDDTTAGCSNWRNVVVPLDSAIRVPAGVPLRVWTTAALHNHVPHYHFHVSIQVGTVYARIRFRCLAGSGRVTSR